MMGKLLLVLILVLHRVKKKAHDQPHSLVLSGPVKDIGVEKELKYVR